MFFLTFLAANCIVRLRDLLLTGFHVPTAFQPARNIDAFYLAQSFRSSEPLCTHLFRIVMVQKYLYAFYIYMQFLSRGIWHLLLFSS